MIQRLYGRLRAAGPVRWVTILAALLVAAVAPAVYSQVRIGVVDIRRAVAQSAEGRAYFDALKTRYDSRQADLDRRTKAIEHLKRSIEHPTAPIPPAKLQKMAQDYQQHVVEFQQIGQQYTAELQQIEAELTKNILVKMQPIIEQIGQTGNYQLIVDEQVVHYAPSHLNLTDEVIQQYNQQHPVHGAVQLPSVQQAPQGPGATLGSPDEGEADSGMPLSAGDGDAGAHALPGVFFRRDAGAH